ncbi:MAG: TonB-dependent receptor, partial [Crocinitomicaceae bacterium]|nr:TonB-dependent receptor [Crocinitomicaceae bacterium]
AGISKPVVRGMQGVRVMTVLNGMRIENQQWGGDHGLGISQLGIGSAEIIKGPSSLLYGADAFGGVIYLSDEKFANSNSISVDARSRFDGVNLGTTNSLNYKLSKKNVRFNAGGLYSSFADFKLPNGKYLENSRFYDHGAKLRFAVNHNNWSLQARYMYSNSQIGISGEVHEGEEPLPENFMVDSQGRAGLVPSQQIQNHFASIENRFFGKKFQLHLLIGHTFNDLAEYEESLDTTTLNMKLNTTLYNFKYIRKTGKSWKLVSGVQGMHQLNSNVEGLEDELIPGFTQFDNGLYSVGYFTLKKISFQLGARFDVRKLKSEGFDKIYASPNFAAGISFKKSDNILRFNISSGFRAPHISELLVEGEHHGALRYEIGNPDLVSERATQFDLNYEFKKDHIYFIINPFYTYVQNYIQLVELDSVIEDLSVYEYDQLDQVQLYGLDFGVHYHPHFAHYVHLGSSYSYIRGEKLNGSSMSLMPQSKIQSNLRFKIGDGSKRSFFLRSASLKLQYFFKQNRTSALETSTVDYSVLDAGLLFHWAIRDAHQLVIAIGAKNLLNSKYVNHLSRLKNIGINEPGRNLYINVKYSLRSMLKNKPKYI